MSRVPAENAAIAAQLIAYQQGRDLTAPDVVAADDQAKAFYREYSERLKAIAANGEEVGARYRELDISPIALGWALAALEASRARTAYICRHGRHGASPTYLELTLGIVSCEACFVAIATRAMRDHVDDSRCDVCDRPETFFYPFASAVGTAIVSGNQCADCHAAMNGGALPPTP
jgi:hypothetical protein